MSNIFVKIALLILPLVLLTSCMLGGCVQRPDGVQNDGEWESKEEFAPSNGVFKDTEALFERYAEYKENSGLAFKQNEIANENDFEFSDYEDGVKIDRYVGVDSIIVIPEILGGKSVLAIGEKAFSTSSIRAVYVPDSVCFIEKSAFEGANAMTTVRLPFLGDGKDITNLGHIFGSNGYSNHAVKVPTTLDMVILGEKTTAIAENAFAGCKSLSAVVLPDSVKNIGSFAFYECKDLIYVNAEKVEDVGEYAFGHCESLPVISLESAVKIGMGALFECNSLHTLSISFEGEELKNRFIGYFFGAETADHNKNFVPKSLYCVNVTGGNIPDRAFASCDYIGNVSISEGVEQIGVRAFYACRSIIEIALPDTMKTICDDAFFGCDNLIVAYLGGAESIGMQAFYGCRSLKSVEIPEGVTEIKPSTFALCSSLEEVKLNNVKKIGKDAFSKCAALNPVDCKGIEVADGNSAVVLVVETAE